MADDVKRAHVIAVLRHNKVLMSDVDGKVTLMKPDGTDLRVFELPHEYVSYRMLQKFQWKYGCLIYQFYHPELLEEENSAVKVKKTENE